MTIKINNKILKTTTTKKKKKKRELDLFNICAN